jgi:alpha(1,3/1,4) fucosyltransferase
MNSLPKKRIAVMDGDAILASAILEFVKDKYDIEQTDDKDAEYVFHSVNGYEVLKYSGVRIFIAGENVSPNFAISDYAMTFDKICFGDRYVWLPLIKLYRESYAALVEPRRPVDAVMSEKSDFCAYVMSNTTNSADERVTIFDLLSAYKKVNSAGKWRNNVGGRVPDKRGFQSRHKFVIAFENCSYPGYLTEKFADAAASNAVPIYWGDPQVASVFNPKAFVNCHDYKTLEEAVARVVEIDSDERLYRQMLAEPWFPEGHEPEHLRDANYVSFLSNIFDQDPALAFRRNRGRWGLKKERQLLEMWEKPHLHALMMLRKRWRKFTHSFISRKKHY